MSGNTPKLFWHCQFRLEGLTEDREITYKNTNVFPAKSDYLFLYTEGTDPQADGLEFYEFFSGEYVGTKVNKTDGSDPQSYTVYAPGSALQISIGHAPGDSYSWYIVQPLDFEEMVKPYMKYRDYITQQILALLDEGRKLYIENQQPKAAPITMEEWSNQTAMDRLNDMINNK